MKTDGTTNASTKGLPEGAYWQHLPGIKNSDAVADLIQDASNPDIVFPQISVKTSEGWKKFTISSKVTGTGMDVSNGIAYINSIDDDYINSLIKRELPSFKGTIINK